MKQNMITFTRAERDTMGDCTVRQILIVNKLATLIDPLTEDLEQYVLIERLIGKGYDDFDKKRVGFLLKILRSMFDDFRIEEEFYYLRFNPISLSYIKKTAQQAAPPNGRGTLYANASLILKRALGIHRDVNYFHPHGYEDFNYGEDTSYLDSAFVGRWRMNFGNWPHKYLKQNIEIHPSRPNKLEIYQCLICIAPNLKSSQPYKLGIVAVSDFIDPERWEIMAQKMAEEARKHVEDKVEYIIENLKSKDVE